MLLIVILACSGAPDSTMASYEKNCHDGFLITCLSVGDIYRTGKLGHTDFERAREFFTIACDGEYVPGCVRLGIMAEEGQGEPQDLQKAREIYSKACHQKKSALACSRLEALP